MVVWIEAESRYGVYERGADRLTGVGARWLAEAMAAELPRVSAWLEATLYPRYYFPKAWAVAG